MLWSPPQRYPPQGKIHSLSSVMLATRLSSNNLEQEKEEEVTKETTFKGQLLTHSCHVKLHIVTIVNVKHATMNVAMGCNIICYREEARCCSGGLAVAHSLQGILLLAYFCYGAPSSQGETKLA